MADLAAEAVAYLRARLAAATLRPDGSRGDPRMVDVDHARWSMALHESAHAVVSARLGVPVSEITMDPHRMSWSEQRDGYAALVRLAPKLARTEYATVMLAASAAGLGGGDIDARNLSRIGVSAADRAPYESRALAILTEHKFAWFRLAVAVYLHPRGTIYAAEVKELLTPRELPALPPGEVAEIR